MGVGQNGLRLKVALLGAVLLVGAADLSLPAAAGERPLIAAGDLKAFVDDQQGWCGRTVEIAVRATSDAPFKDTDRVELQKMLGRIRLALEDECPAATLVRITGFRGDTRVFRGTAAKAHNWVLVEIPLAGVASPPAGPSEKPPSAVTPGPPASGPTPPAAAPEKRDSTIPPPPPASARAGASPGPDVAAPRSLPRPTVVAPAPSPAGPPASTAATPPTTPPAPSAPSDVVPSSPARVTAAVPPSPAPATAPAAPAPTVAAPAPPAAAKTDPVAECDKLAAHPEDPKRTGATGVDDEAIDSERAIAACGEAVKANPKIARLKFQLGRAYWTAERFEEAIEELIEAGKLGHGGALAYLGDAALYGVAGLDPDPETAKGLYQEAANAGFKPAAALASEIVAGVKVEEAQPVFEHPDLIKALVGGSVPAKSGMPQPVTMMYVVSALEGVLHHCAEAIPGDIDLEQSADKAINAALAKLPANEQALVERGASAGEYRPLLQAGLDDGYAVAVAKGCKAKETEALVKTALGQFGHGQ